MEQKGNLCYVTNDSRITIGAIQSPSRKLLFILSYFRTILCEAIAVTIMFILNNHSIYYLKYVSFSASKA